MSRAARQPSRACFHGGASFQAVGERFDRLERRKQVVNADVLDAWFPPAPGALEALREHLPWLARTSPPIHAGGLLELLSEHRNLPPSQLLLGPGSSSLIYLAFLRWFQPGSRVLLLEPSYGEYGHLLERVIGGRVDRVLLDSANEFRVPVETLSGLLRAGRHDGLVLVNPNNPTGRLLPKPELLRLLRAAPARLRVWIDEAYIDYAGPDQSVEREAPVRGWVVCKTLSKVYGLSGLRVAYLAGPPRLLEPLRRLLPPWAVSLPAQVAAAEALKDGSYYADCYRKTGRWRSALVRGLNRRYPGVEVWEGCANFILCRLPPRGPSAEELIQSCRQAGVYLRNAGTTAPSLGNRTVRVAIKRPPENRRILAAILRAAGHH